MEPRPYISRDASFTVETPAGQLEIRPLEKDRVMVDSAWVKNREHPTDGLTLNGVRYGATGFVWLLDGEWITKDDAFGLKLSRRDGYADGTPTAYKKARPIVCEAVAEWAKDHADDLAEADRIWRNNEAHGAEDQIVRAQKYLAELRAIIRANDRGETRSQYSHSFEPLREDHS